MHRPARDAGGSQATGYRYLHEGIDVLARKAPDLHQVLDRCRREVMTHVILDGTLIKCARVAGSRAGAVDDVVVRGAEEGELLRIGSRDSRTTRGRQPGRPV
ncbi:hypothetical protein [Streptomyces sp. NPDC059168]|uniref:hypothetical protein n=1 Tax=Streptomyces sp. NPDC059168 TaxID=3346753 RepID=UPI0036A119EB